MKRNIPVLGALVLALSVTLAGARPALEVTVKNYGELTTAINRIASAVNPQLTGDVAQELTAQAGLTNLASFDTTRPWGLAVWYGSSEAPLLALKGPFTNIAQFKASLSPEGILRKQAQDWTQSEKGFGSIIFGATNRMSESDLSELTQWKGEAIPTPNRTIELSVRLSDPLRAQLKALLGLARESLSQTSTNAELAATGANPKAITEVFDAYFALFDTFVDGFNEMKLGLEATPDALVADELITAKPGSELAKWMQAPADSVTTADMASLDPEASFALAGYFGNSDSLVKLFQKFTAIGLQMQNVETNDAMSKDLAGLFAKTLPMKFIGSLNFTEQFSFSGAYTFPTGNAAEAYGQIKTLFNGSFKSQVGKDKLYSAATLTEKDHTVGGVSVDRVSLTMNLENPMFQLPGQKEQIEALWPGGKLEMDYALKDGKLLVASATGNQMQDLIDGKFAGKATMAPEKGTCLAGYVNLLQMIKRFTQGSGLVPDQMKEGLSKLDAQKTSIEFEMSLDNQLHATVRVPMKLLRELGRLTASF